MATNTTELKVQNLIENIITNLGYKLYDVLYVKEGKDYYLRIIIDKENGIDLNDCEKVNDAITDILDEADYIKEQYFLEVSSPGIERVLRKKEHFQEQIGNEVSIKTFKPINGKKEFVGILKDIDNEKIKLSLNENDIEINLKDISIAKTVYNWNEE